MVNWMIQMISLVLLDPVAADSMVADSMVADSVAINHSPIALLV